MKNKIVIRQGAFTRWIHPLILFIAGMLFVLRSDSTIFLVVGLVLLLGGIFIAFQNIILNECVVLDQESRTIRRTTGQHFKKIVSEFSLEDAQRLETWVRNSQELPKVMILVFESGEIIEFPEGGHRHHEQVRAFISNTIKRHLIHYEKYT